MNSFYVICTDSITKDFTIGKTYKVSNGFIYVDKMQAWNLHKLNPFGLYMEINNVQDINNYCGPVLGARFIEAGDGQNE